jgi:hypothetical protein
MRHGGVVGRAAIARYSVGAPVLSRVGTLFDDESTGESAGVEFE